MLTKLLLWKDLFAKIYFTKIRHILSHRGWTKEARTSSPKKNYKELTHHDTAYLFMSSIQSKPSSVILSDRYQLILSNTIVVSKKRPKCHLSCDRRQLWGVAQYKRYRFIKLTTMPLNGASLPYTAWHSLK